MSLHKRRPAQIIAILLLMLLFLSLSAREPATAAEGAKITVESKTGVEPGDTVSVSVSVTENLDSVAFEFWLMYDSDKLTLTDVSAGSALNGIQGGSANVFSPLTPLYPEPEGKIFFQWDSPYSCVSAAGSVLDLSFEVKSGVLGDASLMLEDAVFYDAAYNEISVECCDGTITVSDSKVISVDISWGDLSYIYSDGTWNPRTHQYENGGWSNASVGGNAVEISNTGDLDVSASLAYTKTRNEISGIFSDGSKMVNGSTTVSAGENKTFYLSLDGKPNQNLDNSVLGTVTVTIGEVD